MLTTQAVIEALTKAGIVLTGPKLSNAIKDANWVRRTSGKLGLKRFIRELVENNRK